MKIIKRNGAEVTFDIEKIRIAITKANEAVDEQFRMTATQIDRIARQVEMSCEEMGRSPAVPPARPPLRRTRSRSAMCASCWRQCPSSASRPLCRSIWWPAPCWAR